MAAEAAPAAAARFPSRSPPTSYSAPVGPSASTANSAAAAASPAAWSPYTSWAGDLPFELPELSLYALLWLESVVLTGGKGGGRLRLQPEAAARKMDALRAQPIPMAALLARASPSGGRRGADAMATLGPVVYAWAQCERVLAGAVEAQQLLQPQQQQDGGEKQQQQQVMEVEHGQRQEAPQRRRHELPPPHYAAYKSPPTPPETSSPSSSSSASTSAWGTGAMLTPRQLFLYLDMASLDTGKRGARLRFGGTTCRWLHPRATRGWQRLLFELPGVRDAMLELLAMPLSVAQSNAFQQQQSPPLPLPPLPGRHAAAAPPQPPPPPSQQLPPQQPPSQSPPPPQPPQQEQSHVVTQQTYPTTVVTGSPPSPPTQQLTARRLNDHWLAWTPPQNAPATPLNVDWRRAAKARALATWLRVVKAQALMMTLRAFDRHISVTGGRRRPSWHNLLLRGTALRALRQWHYVAKFLSLAQVRRARLSLAQNFYNSNAQGNALRAWRVSSVLQPRKQRVHGRESGAGAPASSPGRERGDKALPGSASPPKGQRLSWTTRVARMFAPQPHGAAAPSKTSALPESTLEPDTFPAPAPLSLPKDRRQRREGAAANDDEDSEDDAATTPPPAPPPTPPMIRLPLNRLSTASIEAAAIKAAQLWDEAPPETPTSCQSLTSTVESVHAGVPAAASAAAESSQVMQSSAEARVLLADAQRNAEKVAAVLEHLVRQHGRRLSDAEMSHFSYSPFKTRHKPDALSRSHGSHGSEESLVSLDDGAEEGADSMAGRYARAEWFETQLALEAMQATQAAAISSLQRVGLAVSADGLSLDEGLSSVRTDEGSVDYFATASDHLRASSSSAGTHDNLHSPDLLRDLTSATAAHAALAAAAALHRFKPSQAQ